MYKHCGLSGSVNLALVATPHETIISLHRSKCRCYTNGVAINTTLVFVIFTNGESCFVVERSILEMVDRFYRSS